MKADWNSIFSLSERLGERLLLNRRSVATAESCTGGGIGYAVTHISGSSRWYVGGVNAYSNQIKQEQLMVEEGLIQSQGAVSEPVAEQMALGVARLMNTDIGLSTSGIAGPDGGAAEKPVGTVCFGWAVDGTCFTETRLFSGDRESVRLQSIQYSLKSLIETL